MANQTQHHHWYRPYPENTLAARIIIVVGIVAAIVATAIAVITNADRGWVLSAILMPLIFISGPLVWLMLTMLNQHSGIQLSEDNLLLKYPLGYFNRTIPYNQIGTAKELQGTIALIWLKPRPTAIGDEPRPPKVILLRSVEVQDAKVCGDALQTHLTIHPDWQPRDAASRVRRRAIIRRLLLFVTFPMLSLITVLTVLQIVFAFQVL